MKLIINELKELKEIKSYINNLYKIGILKMQVLPQYNKIKFMELSNINLINNNTDLQSIKNHDEKLNENDLYDLFQIIGDFLSNDDLFDDLKEVENDDFIVFDDSVLLKYKYFGTPIQLLLFKEDIVLVDIYNNSDVANIKNILLDNFINLNKEKEEKFFDNLLKI